MEHDKQLIMNDYQEEFPEGEVSLFDSLRVIWKWKILIAALIFIIVLISAINSLYKVDIYQATAIISPVNDESPRGGLSLLSQQFGGLPGLSLPSSVSTSEITNLMKSNMLREKMIEQYNLLPVLFPEQWDKGQNAWKSERTNGFGLNPISLILNIAKSIGPQKKANSPNADIKNKSGPTMWNGLRKLDSLIKVSYNPKDNTISVSAESHDPEITVKLVQNLLSTLTEHMINESKKAAITKRRYLEDQLRVTSDPIIRQKIYNLISQQVETAMMSEMKEDFVFKVIDQPKVPDVKIGPNRFKIVMISFVASIFFSIFLAFLFEQIIKLKGKKH